MRKLARTTVILFGTVLCGPLLATAATAEPEVRVSAADDTRRMPLCLLCWV